LPAADIAAAQTSVLDLNLPEPSSIKDRCVDQGRMHVEMRSNHVRLPLIGVALRGWRTLATEAR
jgi:hypothetical protein